MRYRLQGLTDHLFAMPTIWSGVGRALDVGGVFDSYNFADTPEETDARAIASDWKAIGLDLEAAIQRYGDEHDQATKDVMHETRSRLEREHEEASGSDQRDADQD